MSSFFFPMLAARFQSSRRGEVPAPTSCCLISALEKVSSNSLKKPAEYLKVKRAGPLSLPDSLSVAYNSSLASRPCAPPKQGRHGSVLCALDRETHPRLKPEVHPSMCSSLKSCSVNQRKYHFSEIRLQQKVISPLVTPVLLQPSS